MDAPAAEVTLSRDDVRRMTLRAQGFLGATPWHRSPAGVADMLRRVGAVQLDTISVLARSHELVAYARLGPVSRQAIEQAYWHASRPAAFEYWAHAACVLPIGQWPYFAFRRRAFRARGVRWHQVTPETCEKVLARLRAEGPLTATQLGGAKAGGPWWDWSDVKIAVEWLLDTGEVICVRRTGGRRVYDLPERVLPDAVLAMPTPTPPEAHKELVRRAAVSHGVATARCLADYYRLRQVSAPDRASTWDAVQELVEDGELIPVEVEGWSKQAYLHRDARRPRKVAARSLLSPFDPVVWERQRTERLFEFHYRIEIYTPAPQRRYGYYVLPFLLGDRVVARVDLKAERAGGVLQVKGAYAEETAPEETPIELAAELTRLAGWLGLDSITVEPRGDLAPALVGLV